MAKKISLRAVSQQFLQIHPVQRPVRGMPIEIDATEGTAESFRDRQTLVVITYRMRQDNPDFQVLPAAHGQ